ncbi:RloB domain-containing protein [Thorsellia kenyensis]|uniref:RloB domain-containing protein n=1 Tax=Thorsellia kenyensis TaxID=1549888 RepID=A0ABV6C727_9GAMM
MSRHRKAWIKAKQHNINIAISCVCFELWILLRFGYTSFNERNITKRLLIGI